MRPHEEKLLMEVVKRSGIKFPDHRVASNPLDNSWWSNLIDGALSGLEIVAIGSFDWKLVGIVKLLQSWIADRRKEKEEQNRKTEWGYNYESVGNGFNSNSGSGSSTYY
jgi:hypothetical protein